jgi:D-serine dehydratase
VLPCLLKVKNPPAGNAENVFISFTLRIEEFLPEPAPVWCITLQVHNGLLKEISGKWMGADGCADINK